MATEGELLERYVRDGSEDSFSALVHLRAAFVYATALRRVGGDSHLANDVTQQVFIALARNARALSRHPVLSGWLYLTTRNIAAQIVRTESRRKKREKESSLMQENLSTSAANGGDPKLGDHLESVLDELNERDRQALLLRFFDGRSFAEIATIVQLTENAARMRVERAMEKLRAAFFKRGVTSTALALGAGLGAHASVPLPAALTATLVPTALASAGLGAGAIGMTFMSLTKTQISIAALAVAFGIGGVAFHENRAARLQQQIDRLSEQNKEVIALREENSRLKQKVSSPTQAGENRNALASAVGTQPSPEPIALKHPAKKHLVALAANLMPVENLDHHDRTTAQAAFSTQIWAAAEGDVDLEQSSILLRPEARAKLEALLATLPPTVRENYGTPERLMASVLAGSPHPVGGMQILEETVQSDNHVVLETQWQHADDSIVHHSNVDLQRDDAGNWQMVVPMVLVDRAVTYLNGNFHSSPASQKP